jgi:hypothetical protein
MDSKGVSRGNLRSRLGRGDFGVTMAIAMSQILCSFACPQISSSKGRTDLRSNSLDVTPDAELSRSSRRLWRPNLERNPCAADRP